jgi:hypothetical protein
MSKPFTREEKLAVYIARGQAIRDALDRARTDECPDHVLIARLRRELDEAHPLAAQFFNDGDKALITAPLGGHEVMAELSHLDKKGPGTLYVSYGYGGADGWPVGIYTNLCSIKGFEALHIFQYA